MYQATMKDIICDVTLWLIAPISSSSAASLTTTAQVDFGPLSNLLTIPVSNPLSIISFEYMASSYIVMGTPFVTPMVFLEVLRIAVHMVKLPNLVIYGFSITESIELLLDSLKLNFLY